MLGNMALIGFALPTALNKMLKNSVEKEDSTTKNNTRLNTQIIKNITFDKLKH